MADVSLTGVLLIGWAALLILGFAFGRPDRLRLRRIPTPIKLASSLILVVCALIWWRAEAVASNLSTFAGLLFFGMACSFLGDAIMSRVFTLPHHLFLSAVAFGLAQVLYLVAYVQLSRVLGLGDAIVCAATVLAVVSSGGLLWWYLVRSPERTLALNVAAAGYAFLLASMTGLALAIALQNHRFAPLALGALLFLLSDLLVGNRDLKGGQFPLMGDVIWVTYIVGQLLIVSSTTVALRLL